MVEFKSKTAAQFRDDFLRSVKNALITQAGIQNPNVSFGTDHYIIGEALGKIAELASYNAIVSADAQMADTATGEDLYRIAAIYGLSIKPAGGSNGFIIFNTSNPSAVVSGSQLIDPSGLRYQVSIGQVYNNGDQIPIAAIDTGTGTNIAAGVALRWVQPPTFSAPTALVATGGLIGGINAETDEELRARLLAFLRNPVGGGNWPQFADLAEKSSSAIQKAFVYPAFNGPSTVLVSVTSGATDTNKNRSVNPLIITQTVLPAIQAGTFEGIFLVVTTVQNQPIDLAFGLTLPAAPTASPAGPGGGWLDGQPFPSFGNLPSTVTNVSNTTQFTVQSTLGPAIGNKVVFIDKTTWTVIHATILAFSQISVNTWSITIDVPFTNIQTTDWIFPDAVNMDIYIETVLTSFNGLGPGQITNIPSLLPYAYRRPLVSQGWFSDITQNFSKDLVNAGTEVLDVQIFYSPVTSPQLPANVNQGPHILVPRNFGFYPRG